MSNLNRGKIMSKREEDMRIEEAAAIEERLDMILTRRDVIEAVELVASHYASDNLIANAFQSLAKALA